MPERSQFDLSRDRKHDVQVSFCDLSTSPDLSSDRLATITLATLGDLVYPPLPMSDPLPADVPPELLTVDEVAELLRVTPSAVRERAKRGAIPGAVEGMKPRRFRAHDVRAWLGLPQSPAA